MKAMILAAGLGTRFGDLTKKIPKPMIELNSIPLIEHSILNLKKSGIKDIIINVFWLGDVIKNYLASRGFSELNLKIIDEKNQILGTGGGIKNALPYLGREPFWLMNSDLFTTFEARPNFKLSKNFLGHLILVENPPHNHDGEFGLNGGLVERKKGVNKLTYSGISCLSPAIFQDIPDDVFPLEPILYKLAGEKKLSGEHFKDLWVDIGTMDRLALAENLCQKLQKSPGVSKN